MARPLRLELPDARAYRDDDYRLREIAGALGCQDSTVSRRLRAFEERGVS